MLKTTKKIGTLMISAITATTLITTQGFASDHTADRDTIRVGALRLGSHAPNFIAYERGYFDDQNLDVNFIYFDAAQPMAVAIASGDVDFGLTAVSGALINLANRGAIKVIGGSLQEEPGVDGQIILASKAAYDDGLTSPEKLAGRSFGITQAGSSFHYMASKIAEASGFSTSDLTLRPLQGVGTIVGALRTAQIDAWSIVPNVGKPLAEADEIVQIGWVADYIPDYQVTTVFTSTRNVNERREMVERFLAAYSAGVSDHNAALVDKTASADEAEAVTRIIAQYIAADQPYERSSVSIQNGAMRINEDAKMNVTNLRDQLEWFQSEGLVSSSIQFETVFDTSFVETY